MDETYEIYTAISMMSGDNHEPLGTIAFPELQILMLQQSLPSDFPSNFFQGMKNLKVLAMSGMNMPTLLSSITTLGNLRTLRLENCELKDVSMICNLKKLLVLSLRNSSIEELPEEFGELTKLRLLDLTGCSSLKKISANVLSRLTLLEGLYMDDSFEAWVIDKHGKQRSQASCQELKALSHLKILEVRVPTIEHFPGDLLLSDLVNFEISIGPRHTKFRDLYPASRILVLSRLNFSMPLKPGPNTLLKKVESLAIVRGEGLKNVAYDLGRDGLSELRSLYVHGCSQVEYITSIIPSSKLDAFPKLEKLGLYLLENLKEICYGELSLDFFCQLQKLKLFVLPGLVNVWSSKSPVKRPCNLRFLIIDDCNNMEFIFSASIGQKLEKLVEFRVSRCHKIYEILSGKIEGSFLIVLHSLKELDFNDLPNLATFWSGGVTATTADSSHGAKVFLNGKILFPSLETLRLKGIGRIEELWILPPIDEDPDGRTFSQLRSVHLYDLPMLRHVWGEGIHERRLSFRNLKVLKIGGCESLENLCVPSVALTLVQLEQLQIEKNKNMKEIIMRTDEADDHSNMILKFPKLQSLALYDLMELRCFCRGSLTLDFPALKTLHLSGVPKLETFIIPGSKSSAASVKQSQVDNDVEEVQEGSASSCILLSQKVSCPSLEGLRISYCHGIKYLFSASAYIRFPELKKLEVNNSKGIQAIAVQELGHEDDTKLVVPILELKELDLDHLPNLISCIIGDCGAQWISLERLKLTSCQNLTTFTGSGYLALASSPSLTMEPFFKQKDNFPALKFLYMEDLKLLEQIWDSQLLPDGSFCQLEVLEIINCPKLVKIIPFNILRRIQNLKELIVKGSIEVEELFNLEEAPFPENHVYNNALSLQVRMLVLASLPKLKHIPWMMFQSLCYVRIRALGALTCLFPVAAGEDPTLLLPHLQKIEELTLADCDLIEDLFPDGHFNDVNLLPRLRRLKFANLCRFRRIQYFRNICCFTAYKLGGWKYLFSSSMCRFLTQLEEISVDYCDDMEEIISLKERDATNGNGVITFPWLKHLKLYDLPRLRCFYSKEYAVELPSLETVKITSCHNMEIFSAGLLRTPKLKDVVVDQKLQGNNDLNVILELVHTEKDRFILESVGIFEEEMNKDLESEEWFECAEVYEDDETNEAT